MPKVLHFFVDNMHVALPSFQAWSVGENHGGEGKCSSVLVAQESQVNGSKKWFCVCVLVLSLRAHCYTRPSQRVGSPFAFLRVCFWKHVFPSCFILLPVLLSVLSPENVLEKNAHISWHSDASVVEANWFYTLKGISLLIISLLKQCKIPLFCIWKMIVGDNECMWRVEIIFQTVCSMLKSPALVNSEPKGCRWPETPRSPLTPPVSASITTHYRHSRFQDCVPGGAPAPRVLDRTPLPLFIPPSVPPSSPFIHHV